MGGSEGVGVTERGAERESAGCGVEHGVLVGVGVDGFGVPDPKVPKREKMYKFIIFCPPYLSAGDYDL